MSLQILDATLREDEQTAGICIDEHIKLAIADLLDEIGVDIIEAGHPLVSPEIDWATRTITVSGRRATVDAHARATRKDIDRALDCGVGFLGIFYCISSERLSGVASVRYALSRIGEDEGMAEAVLARLKEIERKGKTVDLEELNFVVRSCKATEEISA